MCMGHLSDENIFSHYCSSFWIVGPLRLFCLDLLWVVYVRTDYLTLNLYQGRGGESKIRHSNKLRVKMPFA